MATFNVTCKVLQEIEFLRCNALVFSARTEGASFEYLDLQVLKEVYSSTAMVEAMRLNSHYASL